MTGGGRPERQNRAMPKGNLSLYDRRASSLRPNRMNVRTALFTRSSQESRSGRRRRAMRRIWLTLLVHRDALRSDFIGYLQAVLWRLRGLKVRSRNRLAALMGRSPRAYDLWIARVEPRVTAQLVADHGLAQPAIVPIVDASAETGSIAASLESLREVGATAVPVVAGSASGRGTNIVNEPSKLAE